MSASGDVEPLQLTQSGFLRASRSAIDDTISQHLNALSTPSRGGFDPASTSRRPPLPVTPRHLPATACSGFAENVLLPSWQSRSDVLNYCASVATSDDPMEPDRLAERAGDRERVVDERLDPYSGRFFPRETRTETLAQVVRNERSVESIVRERSWKLVNERCGGQLAVAASGWQEALDRWREQNNGRR